jgi:hypothetical protein
MRTQMVRKANNSRRKALTPLFPEHTSQQVIGHVAGSLVKGAKVLATKLVRNSTNLNTPDAEALVSKVETVMSQWHKDNVAIATKKPVVGGRA